MKKTRILTSLAALTTLFTPLTIISSCSCNKNPYQPILAEIKEATINEFKELSKNPRRTGYTKPVCDYLKQKIKSLGYQWYEDGYRGVGGTESNGNIWFDVPATAGFENKPKISLQGHMDMVLVGKDDASLEYAKLHGIEAEETIIDGKDALISKDRKTSLGADDGIGLGLIFALLQNNKVKHGPLKIIITTDEEGGMSGASNFGQGITGGAGKILEDVDGLVNIDDEIEDEIIISSAGSQRSLFTINNCQTEAIPDDSSCYEINISGLIGGHSGDYINDNRCNANKIAADILSKIDNGKLQLISYSNPGLESANVIVPCAKFAFATNQQQQFIQNIVADTISNIKTYHPNENNIIIKLNTIDKPAKACNNLASMSIYGLIQKLLYGVHTMRSDKPNLPESSQNISITTLDLSKDSSSQPQFSLKTMARSSTPAKLETIEQMNKNAFLSTIAKAETQANYSHDNPTHGWVSRDDDKMLKYAKQGIKSTNSEPIIVDIHSGIECSEFAYHKPTINLTSIGPRIDDAHSIKETLYLDSLNKIATIVLHILEHYE